MKPSTTQWKTKATKKRGELLFSFILFDKSSYIYSNLRFFIFVYHSDQVVTQVLDELGLQLNDQLVGLNPASASLSTTNKTAVPTVAGGGGTAGILSDADADLQARLDNLRRE